MLSYNPSTYCTTQRFRITVLQQLVSIVCPHRLPASSARHSHFVYRLYETTDVSSATPARDGTRGHSNACVPVTITQHVILTPPPPRQRDAPKYVATNPHNQSNYISSPTRWNVNTWPKTCSNFIGLQFRFPMKSPHIHVCKYK